MKARAGRGRRRNVISGGVQTGALRRRCYLGESAVVLANTGRGGNIVMKWSHHDDGTGCLGLVDDIGLAGVAVVRVVLYRSHPLTQHF